MKISRVEVSKISFVSMELETNGYNHSSLLGRITHWVRLLLAGGATSKPSDTVSEGRCGLLRAACVLGGVCMDAAVR